MKLKLALAAALVLLLAANTPIFGGHAALAGLVSALILGGLIWRALPGGMKATPALSRMDRIEIRTEGGHGTKTAARHEAGHRRYAKARGWKVEFTEIYPDGAGVTAAYVPKGTPAHEIVGMAEAGAVASGTTAGCHSDFKRRDEVIAGLPGGWIFEGPERAKARREGRALAQKAVGGWIFDGGVGTDAAKLHKHGRIDG